MVAPVPWGRCFSGSGPGWRLPGSPAPAGSPGPGSLDGPWLAAPVPIGVARKQSRIGVRQNVAHCTLVISVAYATKGVDIRHRMGIIEVQAGTKQHRRGRRGRGETARA